MGERVATRQWVGLKRTSMRGKLLVTKDTKRYKQKIKGGVKSSSKG